ncbi:hypothetical protein [Scopulibacillus darangshiensis]|nr:hypothetical protein [Scopulibacillus darangshiensis]
MKKGLFALTSIVMSSAVLAGCSMEQTSEIKANKFFDGKIALAAEGKITDNKKQPKKDEQLVLKFSKEYNSKDKETQKKAANVLLATGAPANDKLSDFKVVGSIHKEKDGRQGTLVLLQSRDENNQLHESIFAVLNHHVFFAYSPDSSDPEIRKQYKTIRSHFKAPVPKSIKKEMK